MKKKRILSMVIAGAVLVGILAACTPTAPPQEVAPPTGQGATAPQPPATADPAPAQQPEQISRGLTVAMMAETPSVAPARHTALIGHFFNVMTHNGLFRIHHEALEPVLDLAKSVEAISDTQFEFRLHENILFHNGEPLTAYDVAASLEYVRTHPEQRAVHGSVVEWEVIDRYTILIDTGVPNALAFTELAHHGNFIMPRSLIESGHDFTTSPIGSGPFVFEDWRIGDSLTFSKFDYYFDAERFPQLAYAHFRIIPEGSSRTIALEAGEVDYIIDVPFPDIPRMEADPRITVQDRPGATFQYFIMNNDRTPFDNVYVRRAIDMAFDRDAMVIASLDGFGIPIWETVPTMFPGASSEGIRSFDPEGAAALLAEQGIDPAAIGFEMLIFDEQQRRRAEVAQSNLADIGIPTTITQVDFATWLTLTLDDAFDSSFANFTANTLVGFMRNLMTIDFIDSQNRARMRNEELSGLVAEALVTVDADAREALLHQASTIANEHVGFLGTNMNIVIRAFDSNLRAPELAANGFMFKNVMYWTQ